ncbi:MAG: phytoene/squalene synthase family protein [Gemmatimonadaceae bacterium]
MTSSDARLCERVTRRHARTFALASYFLPAPKRRAAFAIYAFCRQADDIVDSLGPGDITSGAEGAELAVYRQRLDRALHGEPDDAVFRELAWVVNEFHLPTAVLHELVNGVARDLHHETYRSWGELERYCYGVASTVGVMCTYIFGVIPGPTRDSVLRRAETLGVAMQLTNILRDVGEDAMRARCYLPLDDLTQFGIAPGEIAHLTIHATDPRWQALMQFEISRARGLYADAHSGIASLHRDSQRCATACAVGYARILDAIEQIGYNTLSQRAHVPPRAKAIVLWHAWTRSGPAWLTEQTAARSVPA